MGGEYTAMARDTWKTIDDVSKQTGASLREVLKHITDQHFTGNYRPLRESTEPQVLSASHPDQDDSKKDLNF